MIKACWLSALGALLMTAPLRADAPLTAEQTALFDGKIKPLLETHCFKCHSHVAGKSKGNLFVDSRAALLKGGRTGPVLVPHHPAKSLLLKAVSYTDDQLRMPPTGQLSKQQVALLHEWIKSGAPWPTTTRTVTGPVQGKITEDDRRYWVFQPVRAADPPAVKDPLWSKNPVDRFIRATLEAEGLQPSPPAERLALVRRVYADLIGLPPTPQEIDNFLADTSLDAYERLVDRLLASPRYGERWARHWLDLVRYAESDGYRADEYRPNAWRYRDYVIRSFNADKPYDRFLREQLAGDELYPGDSDALVATGYLRLPIYEFNQRDARTQWQTILDDITEVTGDALLGLGLGCARCHDHKFDSILQKDYYRLQAFFAGIQLHDQVSLATAQERKDHDAQVRNWIKKTATVRAQLEALESPERASAESEAQAKFPPDIQAMLRRPEAQRSPLEKQLAALAYRQVTFEFDRIDKRFKGDKKTRYTELRKELARFDADKPAPLPVALGVRDVGLVPAPVLLPHAPSGPAIEPGFLTVLDEQLAVIRSLPALNSSGRRAALAAWLTRADNPLTARVMVNRLWQHHFGTGVVGTSSDFGRLGDRPSHPELLDWLARRFVEEGWSLKNMHRLMLTSLAYRQSATAPAPDIALKKDPQNRLLWRASTRRLQAEQIRDALLSVTGRLDLAMGGPSVDAAAPRRTIYTKTLRNSRHALLDAFDAPEGVSSTGQRNVTTTPTQALLLINGPFILQQAQALAQRLRKDQGGNDEAAIHAGFRLVFGRPPSRSETSAALDFLRQQAQRLNAAGPRNADEHRNQPLIDLCHVLLNASEFLYVD